MTDPTRDEIAIIALRALEEIDGLTCQEGLAIADGIADAVLALLASKREADVRHFGPIGTHPAPQTADGVPFWRVMPDPIIPHTQTAEPDAWMATTTGSQPKEGDGNE